jgi:hypothetical protein
MLLNDSSMFASGRGVSARPLDPEREVGQGRHAKSWPAGVVGQCGRLPTRSESRWRGLATAKGRNDRRPMLVRGVVWPRRVRLSEPVELWPPPPRPAPLAS